MADLRTSPAPAEDAELVARAAWLYYEASLTQAEISAELQVPPARVQRLISRATRSGLVRILIEGDHSGCFMLERELTVRHGLRYCRVVPALPEGLPPGATISALGRAAAGFLHGAIESRKHRIIGVGHGRTLAAMADHLPRIDRPDLTLVSVIGGVPRRVGTNPFDVVHALAEKTNAAAWVMPVPFYANSPEDRAVLLRQRGVRETLDVAANATLFVMGVGEVTRNAPLCRSGMILETEIETARMAGALAEAYGNFFDATGRRMDIELHRRVLGVDIEALRNRDVMLVAGGPEKTAAIRVMLRTRLPTGLITDEATARALTDGHV